MNGYSNGGLAMSQGRNESLNSELSQRRVRPYVSRGGKVPKTSSAYVFGIDIGGTNTKLGIVNEQGELVCKTRCSTPSSASGPVDITYLVPHMNKLLDMAKLKREQIAGVGLGLPMLFDEYGNITKCFNVNMENDAMHHALKAMFGDKPLALLNDTNAAVMGEHWMGALRDHDSAVMMTLGTGVGGGVICGGKLVVGAHGAAGEFGHMKIGEDETERCACGGRGCLEQHISAKGLILQTSMILKETPESSLLFATLSASRIFEAFMEDDPAAKKAVAGFVQDLSLALARLAVVNDPEVFVIGGGLVYYADCYLDSVRQAYKEEAFPACRDTPILAAELGNKAGVLGAAHEVLQKL